MPRWRTVRIACGIVSLLVLGIISRAQADANLRVTTDIRDGTTNVPLATETHWNLEYKIANGLSSEPITGVRMADVISGKFQIDAVLAITCGTLTTEPTDRPEPGSTKVVWHIGAMAVGVSCELRFDVSTNDGPPQQFTEAGEFCLNGGANVNFLNALGNSEARSGPRQCVEAVP